MPIPKSVAVMVVAVATACAPSCSSSPDRPSTVATHPVDATDPPAGSVPPTASRPTDPMAVAVRYVASTDTLMAHSPIGRREILRQLVMSDAVDDQVAALERATAELATTLDVSAERLAWVEAPLTATVVASTETEASVDVWTVSILGAPESGSPQQVWRTVHVDLSNTAGGWRVSAATADAGPTPAANELSLQATWAEFEMVAGWQPVVEGANL